MSQTLAGPRGRSNSAGLCCVLPPGLLRLLGTVSAWGGDGPRELTAAVEGRLSGEGNLGIGLWVEDNFFG